MERSLFTYAAYSNKMREIKKIAERIDNKELSRRCDKLMSSQYMKKFAFLFTAQEVDGEGFEKKKNQWQPFNEKVEDLTWKDPSQVYEEAQGMEDDYKREELLKNLHLALMAVNKDVIETRMEDFKNNPDLIETYLLVPEQMGEHSVRNFPQWVYDKGLTRRDVLERIVSYLRKNEPTDMSIPEIYQKAQMATERIIFKFSENELLGYVGLDPKMQLEYAYTGKPQRGWDKIYGDEIKKNVDSSFMQRYRILFTGLVSQIIAQQIGLAVLNNKREMFSLDAGHYKPKGERNVLRFNPGQGRALTAFETDNQALRVAADKLDIGDIDTFQAFQEGYILPVDPTKIGGLRQDFVIRAEEIGKHLAENVKEMFQEGMEKGSAIDFLYAIIAACRNTQEEAKGTKGGFASPAVYKQNFTPEELDRLELPYDKKDIIKERVNIDRQIQERDVVPVQLTTDHTTLSKLFNNYKDLLVKNIHQNYSEKDNIGNQLQEIFSGAATREDRKKLASVVISTLYDELNPFFDEKVEYLTRLVMKQPDIGLKIISDQMPEWSKQPFRNKKEEGKWHRLRAVIIARHIIEEIKKGFPLVYTADMVKKVKDYAKLTFPSKSEGEGVQQPQPQPQESKPFAGPVPVTPVANNKLRVIYSKKIK